MRITELKEKYAIDASKALELIEYKEYLPITEKYALATTVADACMNIDRNGLYYMDSFHLNIAFVTKMITTMTNIEIEPTEAFDVYDFLTQSEYMNTILEHIQSEYEATSEIMRAYISDKLSYENSTAKILSEGLEVIYSSVYETGNNIMTALIDSIASADGDTITNLISKLK